MNDCKGIADARDRLRKKAQSEQTCIALNRLLDLEQQKVKDIRVQLADATARAERAEHELQAAQGRYETQCAIWGPVDTYARQHPEMLLGHSVAEHALRLMQERDAMHETMLHYKW